MVGQRERAEAALQAYEAGKGDSADHVIGEEGRAAGATLVYTFNRALHRREGLEEP